MLPNIQLNLQIMGPFLYETVQGYATWFYMTNAMCSMQMLQFGIGLQKQTQSQRS
jgi:hypothetical protein